MNNIRYYIFWILDFLKGKQIWNQYKNIKMLMNTGDILEWQGEKISDLIQIASKNCVYYKDYHNYKNISDCPIIDKGILKDNFDEFVSSKYNINKLHTMFTSGSTGTPFKILQNKEKRNRVLAELIYFNEIVDQHIGDKFIFYRVWTEKNKKSKIEQMKQNLLPVDILHLDFHTFEKIINCLMKNKKSIVL